MGAGSWISIVSLLACLVLAGSALRSHRLNWQKGVTMALAWAAIFAAVTVVISATRG